MYSSTESVLGPPPRWCSAGWARRPAGGRAPPRLTCPPSNTGQAERMRARAGTSKQCRPAMLNGQATAAGGRSLAPPLLLTMSHHARPPPKRACSSQFQWLAMGREHLGWIDIIA